MVTDRGTAPAGLHLEGPFISEHKYGAHPHQHLRTPAGGIGAMEECYGSLDGVRLVTLAPELPGALDCLQALVRRGVRVSLGHSTASLDVADRACDAGACMVTHLFNAMQPFHHRDPGKQASPQPDGESRSCHGSHCGLA
jgi:N-acetylglucosamine-6-phosphate deacetylase